MFTARFSAVNHADRRKSMGPDPRHGTVLVDRSGGGEAKAWPVKYRTVFHMTNDSGFFRTHDELKESEGAYPIGGEKFGSAKGDWYPLYEGKMISTYNHRYAGVRANEKNVSGQGVAVHSTDEQLENPDFTPVPRYWVLTLAARGRSMSLSSRSKPKSRRDAEQAKK